MRFASMLCLLLVAATAHAEGVRGYTKKDGTRVEPHQRTEANSTKADNYSTRGNTNPYNGKEGTKAP